MNLLDRFLGRREEDAFAIALLKRAKRQGHRDLSYDRQAFALVTPERHIPLIDAFLEPDRFSPWVLDALVEALLSPKEDLSYPDVVTRLTPVVTNRMMSQFRNPTRAARPLAEFLEIHLAVPGRLSERIVTNENLESWDVTFDAALEAAIANLRLGPAFPYKSMKDGFFVIGVGDYYDSSRILLPGIFDELTLNGGPVAVVISRNYVAVAGRDDHRALETMARFVDDVLAEENKPVAAWPIVLQDGAWTALVLRSDDSPALRHLTISHALMDYEGQTGWLQAIHARTPDLTVAAYNVTRDGRSWAEWRGKGSTLLPKADTLILIDPGRDPLLRAWEDVETVIGPFESEPDLYPPRYRAAAWTPEARARLETEFRLPAWLP
jgi:hypothetical protein